MAYFHKVFIEENLKLVDDYYVRSLDFGAVDVVECTARELSSFKHNILFMHDEQKLN